VSLLKKRDNRREAFLMQMIMTMTKITSAFTKMYILKMYSAKDILAFFG